MSRLVQLTANKHARFSTAFVVNLFLPGLGNLLVTGCTLANFLCFLLGFLELVFFDFKIRVAWVIVMCVKAYVDIYVAPSVANGRHKAELKSRQAKQQDDHPAELHAKDFSQSDLPNEEAHGTAAGRAGDHPGSHSSDHPGSHSSDHLGSHSSDHLGSHSSSGPQLDNCRGDTLGSAPIARNLGDGTLPHLTMRRPVTDHGHSNDAMREAQAYFDVNMPTAHVNHPHPIEHKHDLHAAHPELQNAHAAVESLLHSELVKHEHHDSHLHQAENPLHIESVQKTEATHKDAEGDGDFGYIVDIYGEEENDTDSALSPLADGMYQQIGESQGSSPVSTLIPLETAGIDSQASHDQPSLKELCPTCQNPRQHRRPVCPACGTHFEDAGL